METLHRFVLRAGLELIDTVDWPVVRGPEGTTGPVGVVGEHTFGCSGSRPDGCADTISSLGRRWRSGERCILVVAIAVDGSPAIESTWTEMPNRHAERRVLAADDALPEHVAALLPWSSRVPLTVLCGTASDGTGFVANHLPIADVRFSGSSYVAAYTGTAEEVAAFMEGPLRGLVDDEEPRGDTAALARRALVEARDLLVEREGLHVIGETRFVTGAASPSLFAMSVFGEASDECVAILSVAPRGATHSGIAWALERAVEFPVRGPFEGAELAERGLALRCYCPGYGVETQGRAMVGGVFAPFTPVNGSPVPATLGGAVVLARGALSQGDSRSFCGWPIAETYAEYRRVVDQQATVVEAEREAERAMSRERVARQREADYDREVRARSAAAERERRRWRSVAGALSASADAIRSDGRGGVTMSPVFVRPDGTTVVLGAPATTSPGAGSRDDTMSPEATPCAVMCTGLGLGACTCPVGQFSICETVGAPPRCGSGDELVIAIRRGARGETAVSSGSPTPSGSVGGEEHAQLEGQGRETDEAQSGDARETQRLAAEREAAEAQQLAVARAEAERQAQERRQTAIGVCQGTSVGSYADMFARDLPAWRRDHQAAGGSGVAGPSMEAYRDTLRRLTAVHPGAYGGDARRSADRISSWLVSNDVTACGTTMPVVGQGELYAVEDDCRGRITGNYESCIHALEGAVEYLRALQAMAGCECSAAMTASGTTMEHRSGTVRGETR